MKKIKLLFVFAVMFVATSYVYAEGDIIPLIDTVPPVITLVGDAEISIHEGETYTDAGVTALDDVDGDITSLVSVTGTVDTAHVGVYVLSYTVHDDALNEATAVTRTVNVIPLSETVLIRSGENVVFSGDVLLPASGTISIPDQEGISHDVNARSVLGFLYALDQESDAFSISNLTYYSSFNAFYLKCITVSGENESCDNWQYVVQNVTPWESIDARILTGGETIGVYFGQPHQVRLSGTSLFVGDSLSVTAEKYNYEDNTWVPLLGVTVGATVPNPDDPYTPTVVTSVPVDENGVAVISFSLPGTYSIGIAEDYYYPSTNVVVSSGVGSGGGSGGSGGGGGETLVSFNVSKAVLYLSGVQDANGSFGGNDMYTDWVAIALGAFGQSQAVKTKTIEYIESHHLSGPMLTDFERRAMAILALGKNPYTFNGEDNITPIVKEFDGTQFGDSSLVNDDIFALIPLYRSGYSSVDTMVASDVAFIISKQKPNGSWEESVDVTASAIQALSLFSDVSGVSASIDRARTYLESMQSSDGGFGSVYSTSWVLQAEKILGVSFVKNGKTTNDYLAHSQSDDGGVLPLSEITSNRIWATSYAIPAVLGKSWGDILHSVSKPASLSEKDSNDSVIKDQKEIVKKEEPVIPVVENITPVVKPLVKKKNTMKISEKTSVVTPVSDPSRESQLAQAGNTDKRIPRSVVIGAITIGALGLVLSRFSFFGRA